MPRIFTGYPDALFVRDRPDEAAEHAALAGHMHILALPNDAPPDELLALASRCGEFFHTHEAPSFGTVLPLWVDKEQTIDWQSVRERIADVDRIVGVTLFHRADVLSFDYRLEDPSVSQQLNQALGPMVDKIVARHGLPVT